MKPYLFLQIISPEKTLFKGNVTVVRFPGKKAPFVVLKDHAPIMSLLEQGVISFEGEFGKKNIPVTGGFVQVKKNRVYACIDPIISDV
ncbi:MAG: F0F1 ATP synthase subunit epsilon [Bacteroidales bacterium]|jgi:F-type H+-transporting ATPase subunit epsilon|nr:F0F1 ATP synthase subunit epsilon [Bacteroidales bacterium]NLK79707.1 F0F1 ATP synthase subunit epsilon [Bacteroidales bacterium]HKM31040.1 F0F1 ATP synthase subunit epsilon [Bacteroidales bacterium]